MSLRDEIIRLKSQRDEAISDYSSVVYKFDDCRAMLAAILNRLGINPNDTPDNEDAWHTWMIKELEKKLDSIIDQNSPAQYPKKVTCEDCGGEQMKVLYSSGEQRYLNSVPMKMLIPYENQAIINHSQTLARLNERGGLGLHEMYAIMNDGLLPSKGKFEAVMKIPIGTILKSLDCPSCTDGYVTKWYEQVVREECRKHEKWKECEKDIQPLCDEHPCYFDRPLEIASEVEATEKMGMRQAEDFGPPVPCIESAIKTFQGKEVIERGKE
jgi:hypothetical protein